MDPHAMGALDRDASRVVRQRDRLGFAALPYLIGFASGRLPMLAWQESVTAVSILSDEMQVRELEFTHTMAMQQSLSTEESLRLVRRYAEG